MINPKIALECIKSNNQHTDSSQVTSVLVYYDDANFYLGDSCIVFDKLKMCRQFFPAAAISLNCVNDAFAGKYLMLLKNNPHIDHVYTHALSVIDFDSYDVVICITEQEGSVLNTLDLKYGDLFLTNSFHTAIYSFSKTVFPYIHTSRIIFPEFKDLLTVSQLINEPKELYIATEEKQWANEWFRAHGVMSHERIFIILDSSSTRDKLLTISAYYELLMWILQLPGVKILIFDERKLGKATFYEELLGSAHIHKFIFSSGMTLREDLSLISADQVKFILGPCTGLMHCASGIYNHFVNKGMPVSQVPFMVTYTGKSLQPANYWWNNAPLMHVLIIRFREKAKEIVLLSDLSEADKNKTDNLLSSSDYTADMLISFIEQKISLAVNPIH
jgi:hypothetical protein